MKPVVLLAIAIVAAGGAFWVSSDTADPTDDVVSDIVGNAAEKPEAADQGATGDKNFAEIVSTILDAAEQSETEQLAESSDISAPQTDSAASPFAVSQSDNAPVVEPAAVSQPQTSEQLPVVNDVASNDGAQQRSSEPVVVPSSYPVTDAEKYFIPKEERGPGRLGGPPPLNFPGGPSDPNSGGGSTFLPPPAPGQ